MGFTNSPLVTYKRISPHKSVNRKHAIDTITIHCIVGQWTAKQGCDYFATTDRECSANYVVGKDGSIGLSVEEKDRAWTSGGTKKVNGISGSENDHRAITIEVASDTKHPYAVTAEAYKALIALLVDICKRNNIKELKWKADPSLVGQVDKQNMTVHRWFANKSCPGDYLYERHGDIAEAVNRRLKGIEPKQTVDVSINVLRKGMKNNHVKVLQCLLIAKGYPCGDSGIDGSFGPVTQATVLKFQKDKGLTVDGVVGRNTWTELLK